MNYFCRFPGQPCTYVSRWDAYRPFVRSFTWTSAGGSNAAYSSDSLTVSSAAGGSVITAYGALPASLSPTSGVNIFGIRPLVMSTSNMLIGVTTSTSQWNYWLYQEGQGFYISGSVIGGPGSYNYLNTGMRSIESGETMVLFF